MAWRGRWVVVLLLAIAPLLSPVEAATPRQAKEAELKQLRSRIDSLRTDLNRVRNRYDGMRDEMRDIEQRIATIQGHITQYDSQLQAQMGKLRGLERKQQRLQSAIDEQRDQLARQLRAAYMAGRQEYVKILLNQEDPAAVGRVITYYDYLNRARTERIDSINSSLSELAGVKDEINSETSAVQALRDKAAGEKQDLEASRSKRALLMVKLKGEISSKDQQLARLVADEKAMERLVESLSRALEDIPPDIEGRPFKALKGRLSWPTKGAFLVKYGSPRKVGSLTWSGVLINAPEGQQVRAISHGRVAFADWLRGYGLLLIIDHGDGYMSLYGYNQTLYKSVGDWVKAGDVVASVGATGGQERSGLYFEIRHNGKPTNPAQWCR